MQDAAVLIPIYRSADGDLRIVMVLRSSGGVHGGQVAFPGGKRDDCDLSMLECALREAREEVGLTADGVEILAHLPVTETRTTGYRVYPFLARIKPPVQWQTAEREIAAVIDVSLSELVRPESHDRGFERFSTWQRPAEVPFYRVGEHRLWGLSYRILHPLLPRLIAGEWPV
jgi:8-oxo-dGTP pyrophosphatase MutT (NUDIX family)